jgi:hypothetical protein
VSGGTGATPRIHEPVLGSHPVRVPEFSLLTAQQQDRLSDRETTVLPPDGLSRYSRETEADKYFASFDQKVKKVNEEQEDKVKRAAEWENAVRTFIPVARPVLERYRDSFKERGITMEFHTDEARPSLSVRFVRPNPGAFSKNDRVAIELSKGLHNSVQYEYVWVTCRGGHLTKAYGGYSGDGEIDSICSVKLLEELVQRLAREYVHHFVENKA